MSEQTTQRSKGLLDPIERLSEVLFGLIMVLSFTGSLSAATAGREEIRTMLFGAIGCNLAWGDRRCGHVSHHQAHRAWA